MFYLMFLFIDYVFYYVFIYSLLTKYAFATLSVGYHSTILFSKATHRRQCPKPSSTQYHHLAAHTLQLLMHRSQPSSCVLLGRSQATQNLEKP